MNNHQTTRPNAPTARKPIAHSTRWERGRLVAAASLLLLLVACGPGVGGTGVGPSAYLSAFGATAVPVCLTSLAPTLQCTIGSTTTSNPPKPDASHPIEWNGTATVRYADGTGRVRLRLSDNRVDLQDPCEPLQFDGEFGQVADQPPRFYGRVDSPNHQGLASLRIITAADGLTLTLLDQRGNRLLGPLEMKKTEGDAALVLCER